VDVERFGTTCVSSLREALEGHLTSEGAWILSCSCVTSYEKYDMDTEVALDLLPLYPNLVNNVEQ
jgi:hypothetical protein